MEIKTTSQTAQPARADSSIANLLSLLRAAGSIEAEVVERLPGELLLQTRLGQFLAKNSLGFRQGDKLQIRLDESRASPLLKANLAPSEPVLISNRQLPELARLIPLGRPLIARIVQLQQDRGITKYADKTFELPLPRGAAKGALLSLTKNRQQAAIEIRLFDPKPVYRSLIQQLLPQQRDSAITRLASLLGTRLVSAAGPPQANSNDPQGARIETAARLVNVTVSQPVSEQRSPVARFLAQFSSIPVIRQDISPPRLAMTESGAGKLQQAPDSTRLYSELSPRLTLNRATGTTDTTQQKLPPQPVFKQPALAKVLPAVEMLSSSLKVQPQVVAAASPAATRQILKTNPAIPRQSENSASVTAKKIQPGDVVNPAARLTVATVQYQRLNQLLTIRNSSPSVVIPQARNASAGLQPGSESIANPVAAKSTSTKLTAAGVIGKSTQANAAVAAADNIVSAAQLHSPSMPAQTIGSAPAAIATPNLAAVANWQPLFNSIIKLASIDHQQLKNWFGFWSLIKTTGDADKPLDSINPFKLLRRIADRTAFVSDILNPRDARSGRANQIEAAVEPELANRAEISARQIADAIKLIEQSLLQPLLQRATVGLQQENQQPLNFSISLPVIDENRVIPLNIQLHQRDPKPQQQNKCWEIRISFEFAQLGPVCCHIVLDGVSVAASFYSEMAQTQQRIGAALNQLEQQLVVAGFTPAELHSFPGKPASFESEHSLPLFDSLLDVRV